MSKLMNDFFIYIKHIFVNKKNKDILIKKFVFKNYAESCAEAFAFRISYKAI
jgi:hypothetical protein